MSHGHAHDASDAASAVHDDDLDRMVKAGILGHDERVELIDGEIVAMSAKENRHEGIKVSLTMLGGRVCPPDAVFAPGPRSSTR